MGRLSKYRYKAGREAVVRNNIIRELAPEEQVDKRQKAIPINDDNPKKLERL